MSERKYLVGPVSAQAAWACWQGPRTRGVARAFNDAGDTDLTIGPGDGWDDVCRRLPDGWRPDFVVVDCAYTSLPGGCPGWHAWPAWPTAGRSTSPAGSSAPTTRPSCPAPESSSTAPCAASATGAPSRPRPAGPCCSRSATTWRPTTTCATATT